MLAAESVAGLENINIMRGWSRLKEAINRQPGMRPVTVESWNRCRKMGVDPLKLKPMFLPKERLKPVLKDKDYLIKIARPYLDFLSLNLTGIPHVVMLLNGDGWVMDIQGTIAEYGGEELGLCVGACWGERYMGNTGGGTAISTGRPVFIYGKEHFLEMFKPLSCLGVPIFKENKLIGAISISVPNEYAHPGRLIMATSCAEAIEKEISKKTGEDNRDTKSTGGMIVTSELMATVIHDLKNPLASIRGLGQLGILASTTEKERSYFERIIKQADKLNNSVVDLLSIFKPEKPTMAKPDDIIEGIIEEMGPNCDINNIELILETKNNSKVNLFTKVFRRAIENLIKNAIQVLRGGGKIKINISDGEEQVLISIKDNGPGIPTQIKGTLFEPFVCHGRDGTGLGLFMVQHAITDVHGGRIWFKSQAGKGTTFYVSLPKL